jgi:hypothetical protein
MANVAPVNVLTLYVLVMEKLGHGAHPALVIVMVIALRTTVLQVFVHHVGLMD